MITGIDHVVIAARDLARAVGAYQRLGFEIALGGRHPGAGTHNALVRFPQSFLELVSVHDEGEERAHGTGLGAILAEREGLVGFALRSDDIRADARRLREAGFPVSGPLERSRDRPDGRTLRWSGMAVGDPRLPLGALLWSSPLPFVIQWNGPAAGYEPAGVHANGALDTASVTLRVAETEGVASAFSDGFGLAVEDGEVRCGPMRIRLVSGEAPGIESVDVAVSSIARTRDELRARGVSLLDEGGRLVGAVSEACGCRLTLVTAAASGKT